MHRAEATTGSTEKKTDASAAANSTAGQSPPAPVTTEKKPADSGPSYPTSSRSGPKNWDKIVDEDLDGKKVEEEEEEDGVNSFFRKIYKNAPP